MKQAVGALFMVLSLPLFMFGGPFLVSALRLHWGQPFCASSPEDYAVYGAIWVGMALLVLVPSALVLLKKNVPGTWLVVPLLVLLLSAVAIPSNIPPGYRGTMAGRAVERRMQSAAAQLQQWGSAHGQLPEDEGQLRGALEPKAAAEEEATPSNSRYQRADQPVPYRFLLVPKAQGPRRPQPPLEQPAIVYCAISADRKKFWLTATALPGDVSSEVVVLERDGEFVVISGEIPPQSAGPAPVAAPEKKPQKSAPVTK